MKPPASGVVLDSCEKGSFPAKIVQPVVHLIHPTTVKTGRGCLLYKTRFGEQPSRWTRNKKIDEVPLALIGRVPCKVSAENGPKYR